jgi:hypothetical protein
VVKTKTRRLATAKLSIADSIFLRRDTCSLLSETNLLSVLITLGFTVTLSCAEFNRTTLENEERTHPEKHKSRTCTPAFYHFSTEFLSSLKFGKAENRCVKVQDLLHTSER